MKECVIVMAKRTPIGKKGGILRSFEPEKLVSPLIKQIVKETNINSHDIDDVIIGNVVGPGGNIARLSALEAELPVTVPGVTIDRQCGSGLEAIHLAARLIQSGAGDIYLAGGVDSTSRAPWKMFKPNSLMEEPEIYSRAPFTPKSYGDPEMGIAAEHVAQKYGITREEQDYFALQSHHKAVHSQKTNRFKSEIVPMSVGNKQLDKDECPRNNSSLEELLKRLPPVFSRDGSVTAGNSCPINDGAAIALLMSYEKAKALGVKPLLRFIDAKASGVDPNLLGIGPIPAVQQLLKRQHLRIDDIDLVEFNEAFAAQALACIKKLKIDMQKVNIGGGALAIGHPYGASGAILITRLCAEMQINPFNKGIATLGIGGGIGLAVLVEGVNYAI